MDIETIWYELSPYLYIVTGIFLIFKMTSGLLIFSGTLLILAAVTQFRLRWVNRRKLDRKVKRPPRSRRC